MNNVVQHSYNGMMQDITKPLMSNQFYFEGRNIRIIATDTQGTKSVINEKGNLKVLTVPIPQINSLNSTIDYSVDTVLKTLPYVNKSTTQPRNELEETYFISENNYRTSGTQIIIGNTLVRDDIILFTTDNNGFDCIWKVDDITFDVELLYLRDLGFNINYPIQSINNYENKNIDKVYWVDGKNQMRFVNIYHSEENLDLENLIDLSFNNINMVGTFDINQPEIVRVSQGGIHTSGMIQYAYNLYKVNGSQTKISPLTELIPLNKGSDNGGGDVNEIVGSVPIVRINDLDDNYTNLKLYAVKYTSYNQIPEISLILDKDVSSVNTVTYFDDGNVIESLSLEEFTFLGSDVIIPKHINSKRNILFLANYEEKDFDIDNYGNETSIDCRAYSFASNSNTTEIYNSLEESTIGSIISSEPSYTVDEDVINGVTQVPYKHSAININYDQFNKQYNNDTVGGEGPFIKYEIFRNQVGINDFTEDDSKGKFFKDDEVYRIALQFYNKFGQISLPKWVADFKNIIQHENVNNLSGDYASIKITFKPLFYIWLNDDNNFLDENGIFDESLKPIGYRLLRSERTLLDRTIICQGLINGMLSQVNGDSSGSNDTVDPQQIERVHNGLKIPSMMRRFDEYLCPMWRNKTYDRLDRFTEYHPNWNTDPNSGSFLAPDSRNEVYKNAEADQWTQGTYQFNKLFQLFSPEIIFNTVQDLSQAKLRVIGGLENNDNSAWQQVRETETQTVSHEVKVQTAIYPYDVKAVGNNINLIKGVPWKIQPHGFFGHADGSDMNFVQTYRKYTGNYFRTSLEESIYGVPEIAETGQGRTMYNNDADFYYSNSLQPLSADSVLTDVNSWGIKSAMFALGPDDIPTPNRKGIEDIFENTGIVDTGVGLISELRIPRNLIYLGNIYGGNSYESKKRSNYIEVGQYQEIDNSTYNCLNGGDTFVADFKFTKMVKTETERYSRNSEQVTEIVEFKVETTVDIKNRNDLSLKEWDNRFQPTEDEYQNYNTVYSQESNLIIRRDTDFKFKKVEAFDTNIISTKTKVPGEIIDNWTDLQPNNTLTLDGKYGSINSLHNFKDNIYALQDNAVSFISILPRVQVQGSDGFSVELGSGQVLQEAEYLSTSSGTKNKWSVVNSPSTFYYYDTLNKSINSIANNVTGLTDLKGMHTYFMNNINHETLLKDNPLLKEGVCSGYDYLNNEVIFTFSQGDKSFTLTYNEQSSYFTSFYDYLPNMYISKGDNLLLLSPDNSKLYKQFEGEYNTFFDEKYPSSIILNVNPQQGIDCIYDNINFKSEVSLDGVDIPNMTINKIQAYNEYQNSGLVSLSSGRNSNLRRKFRDWNALIPRERRERIRNPYMYLKLQFDNEENYKLILHNINVWYSTF